MPYKEPNIEKLYYSISEVSELFHVKPSLIRFWEEEFPLLKPKRTTHGNRLYTKDDIEQIQLIYHLVKEKGMTLKGAQKKLKENKEDTIYNFDIIKKLKSIRIQLSEILNVLDKQ